MDMLEQMTEDGSAKIKDLIVLHENYINLRIIL